MKRKDFNQLVDNANFRELFITEMGWNNPSNEQEFYIIIDATEYHFSPIAEKQGFQVYTCAVDLIPTATECKKIDNKLRNYGYDYICIFVQNKTSHHLWLTPVKTNEKRELVKTEYAGSEQAEFLFQKVDDLSFGLTEHVVISDVKARVQGSFNLNSEKITKDFYAQFKKEHTAFKKHISGIADDKNKDWYASVMLNRLMFCYFIQKKGFLDMNSNYLHDKLKWVKEQQGEDKFFGTFYKGFLCSLFHDGLNSPRHDSDNFLRVYGRIPYLNGGMFEDHQLERENSGIDIADNAFETLFAFFDKWNWHLDTRLTASGKDINPDVLGYIFEQYINDRAAMGAYYTKEDITEYIGKNCILPFLVDKSAEKSKEAFKPNGFAWKLLQQSGEKYVYDAVKKGHSSNWKSKLPDYISKGIELLPEQHDLLERRSRWNEKTHDEFALPMEIWRETIERLQRCDSLLAKISNGEINQINDFITYNLDIRRFVEDVLRSTPDHLLVAHFYQALQNVTILDPTCGSGAFLFAALNILEPLYEACLDRMEEFHKANPNLFKDELEDINARYSNNRQYFIYKSIILRNLYGVDIMVEATEIAKLRLFLKMVAVVEVDKRKDNLGLDPLPDIDFNIKCGNSLVGYATEKELQNALSFGDPFAKDKFEKDIENKMCLVSKAYELFRSEQLRVYDDNASIKQTKEALKERLKELNVLLNKHMHQTITAGSDYEGWLKSHQPFHWLAEFYQIIKGNGGFDVIIGNPPYVEYSKVKSSYSLDKYKTISSGNIYAQVLERGKYITNTKAHVGWIVPISVACTDRTISLQDFLAKNYQRHISSFDIFPAKLFDGAAQRVSILLLNKGNNTICTSKYYRWQQIERSILISNISYLNDNPHSQPGWTARANNNIPKNILQKLNSQQSIGQYFLKNSSKPLYVHRIINNFIKAIDFEPYFKKGDGTVTHSEDFKLLHVSPNDRGLIICILNSNLFYWYWRSHGDGFHCGYKDIEKFRFSIPFVDSSIKNKLDIISKKLVKDFDNNSEIRIRNQKSTGKVELQTFFIGLSKPIIDEIDKVLAEHYGFTEEELDFIINYDIKYRMGDELNEE